MSDQHTPSLPEARYLSRLIKRTAISGGDIHSLRYLKDAAITYPKTRNLMLSTGIVPVLGSSLSECSSQLRNGDPEALEKAELSIAILRALNERAGSVLERRGSLDCISWVLRWGSEEGKRNAVAVVEGISICERRIKIALGRSHGLIKGLVELLRAQLCSKTVLSSLNSIVALCCIRECRVKAVEAGAVSVIAQVLGASKTIAICEKALSALEILFLCEEGREAAVKDCDVILRIVEKMCGVSSDASEYAVGALWTVCTLSHFLSSYCDAIEAGAIKKLVQLLKQSDISHRTKSQGVELLKSLQTATLIIENDEEEKMSAIHATTTNARRSI